MRARRITERRIATSRRFFGQRALRITLRAVHIGAVAMVIGAVAFGGDAGPWPLVLVLSGLGIVADDLYKYGIDWLRYPQGQAVVVKIAVVVAGVWTGHLLASLWVALVVGAVISHAPGRIRQHALWGEPGPCARKGV